VKPILWAFALPLAYVGFAMALPVDINSATESDLIIFEGMSPTVAKAVVDYRTRNGPYKSIADLSKAGVDSRTIWRMSMDFSVAAPPLTKAASPPTPAQAAAEKKAADAAAAKKEDPPTK
jgi:competence protein ComEA